MTKPGNEADTAAARLQALADAHHGWAIDFDMREVVADRARLVAKIREQAGEIAAAKAELAARALPPDEAIAEAIRRLRAEYAKDSTAWTALSHALSIAQGATVEMRGQAGPELNEQDDDA